MPAVREWPSVSIGLPVFNGEDYVAEAITSIVSQTYKNIEIIISDNASSDRTGEICRNFAARDSRVRYHRNEQNLGASRNYEISFGMASGAYFKWAADDDVLAPTFIERCVEVLEADREAVLCYSKTTTIDGQGQPVSAGGAYPAIDAAMPHERFRASFFSGETYPVWGLIRTEVLRRTRLLGPFVCHDRTLLAELALHGRFHCIDEFLFFHREHPGRSVRVYDQGRPDLVIEWYAPSRGGGLVFAEWRLLAEYWAGLRRAPITTEQRLWCLMHLARWAVKRPVGFARDLALMATRLPFVGRHLLSVYLAARAYHLRRKHQLHPD
jgi:glycosyltransferase involved in cell wall biosynthesis